MQPDSLASSCTDRKQGTLTRVFRSGLNQFDAERAERDFVIWGDLENLLEREASEAQIVDVLVRAAILGQDNQVRELRERVLEDSRLLLRVPDDGTHCDLVTDFVLRLAGAEFERGRDAIAVGLAPNEFRLAVNRRWLALLIGVTGRAGGRAPETARTRGSSERESSV